MKPRIPSYELHDILGRGGMGVVYEATQLPSGKAVAVKTVRLATETTLESIRREIQTLRELHHPGVIEILDSGVADGMPWYAMELLRGRTLADDLRSWFPAAPETDSQTRDLMRPQKTGPMPRIAVDASAYSLATVTERFRRICEPLAYVHGQGVTHRDLSPGNVFIVEGERPMLFDFGLAGQFRTDSARAKLEVGGAMRGTAHYMSPEQVRGEVVDARADIYALGCMLYEALAGRPPFLGTTPLDVLMQHLEAQPVSPAVFAPDLPRELEQLVMHMLAKRPRDRIGYAEDVAARLGNAPTPEVRARPYTYRPELAGRTVLIDALDASLIALASGVGGIALLAGESGVGKTRLATELGTRALDHGLRVITGECEPISARGTDVHAAPLHPLRPMLRAVADRCRDTGAEETKRLLGPLGGLLAVYEPALAGLAPAITDRVEPTAARFRVLAVLRDTLRELTRFEPTVLVIDDLQWADELTLALLSSLGPANLFVVATVRSEEMTPAIGLAMRGAVRYDVPRLGTAAVGAMVRDMLALDDDVPALAELIATRSEGNPLFAAEYVRAAVEEGALVRDADGRWQLQGDVLHVPGSARSVVTRRLHSLSPAAMQVAIAASVLGRSCDAAMLGAIAGDAAIPELLQRHVLEEAGGNSLRFAHDTLREEAYASLGATERAALHRKVAGALEARYRSGITAELHMGELAHHWEQAGELGHAADYLERAASYALENAAFGEAKTLWSHALGLPIEIADTRRAGWERALGEAHFALGDLAGCATHLQHALARLGHALPTTKLRWSAVLAGGLSRQMWSRAVGRKTGENQALAEAALASARMTSYYFFNDDTLGFLGSALRAINLAERVGTSVAVAEIYGQLGYIAAVGKLDGVAREYFARALEVADASHDPVGKARVLFSQAAIQLSRGSWDDARANARRGLEIAEALRNPQDYEVAHTILGHCDFATGDYPASREEARVLFASAKARANAQHESWGVYTEARVLLYMGQVDEAIALFERAWAMLASLTDRASVILCGGMLACAYARAGRRDEAKRFADETTERIGSKTPPVFTISEGFICTADAYLTLGDKKGAKRAIANLLRLAKTFPIAMPAALAFQARLSGKRTFAEKSLALAEQLHMPYDQAIALRELGEHDRANAILAVLAAPGA